MEEKKERLRQHVCDMLEESYKVMIRKVDKALNSSAVDIEGWDEKNGPMILPKCIVTAILQDESTQYEGKGTSFEKMIRIEVRNIKLFI